MPFPVPGRTSQSIIAGSTPPNWISEVDQTRQVLRLSSPEKYSLALSRLWVWAISSRRRYTDHFHGVFHNAGALTFVNRSLSFNLVDLTATSPKLLLACHEWPFSTSNIDI